MRYTLALAGALLSTFLMAQEGPKISTAVIQIDQSKDTVKAKGYIEEAAQIISTKDESQVRSKDLAKFYFYYGKINYAIYSSKTPAIHGLDTAALDKAEEGIRKVLAFEKKTGKQRWSNQAETYLKSIALGFQKRGLKASDAENHKEAYDNFMFVHQYKLDNELGTDTSMLYNAAVMAQKMEDYTTALKHTKQLVDMKYKGEQYKATQLDKNSKKGGQVAFGSRAEMDGYIKTGSYVDPLVEGDIRADLQQNLAVLYKATGDTVKYDATVAAARKLYPENKNLLLMELDKFIANKEIEKAMVNLDQAIAADPKNYLYPYLKGYFYDTELDDKVKAKEWYDKSIAVNPDEIEAQYMSGLLYVTEANRLTAEINKLSLSEKTKYAKLQEEQQVAFKAALPYFEKSREIKPDDIDTLKALKEVYYRLKMYQEAKETQAVIDAMAK